MTVCGSCRRPVPDVITHGLQPELGAGVATSKIASMRSTRCSGITDELQIPASITVMERYFKRLGVEASRHFTADSFTYIMLHWGHLVVLDRCAAWHGGTSHGVRRLDTTRKTGTTH